MKISRRVTPIAMGVATLIATCASAVEIPAEYRATVQLSNVVGNLVALHQTSADLAHEELARRGILGKDTRVRGWITDFQREPPGVLVTYVGDEGGVPHALYRVMIPTKASPTVETLSPAAPLDESERARFAARDLALTEFAKRGEQCAKRYETVVLPFGRERDPYIYVYLLAASDKPRVAVAGGDMRYEISADGAHIDDQRTFGTGCQELAVARWKDREKGEAIKMTHVADPTPTEWHILLSRKSRRALDVETPESGLKWVVRAGKIEFVEPIKTGL